MTAATPHKLCPRCGRRWLLSTPKCLSCGRQFRTQFTPPPKPPPPPPPPDQTTQMGATKACPVCQKMLSAAAAQCPGCGHPFRVCPVCRTSLAQEVQACPRCRHAFHPLGGFIQRPAGRTSPGMALCLSLLITGAGQIYNGQWAKGLVVLLATILASVALGCLGLIVLWTLSAIDAYAVAQRLNRSEPIAAWTWF